MFKNILLRNMLFFFKEEEIKKAFLSHTLIIFITTNFLMILCFILLFVAVQS
jgi:hypothetical protein